MFFDSEEKAKEYADKKGLKISPKKGYNMEESLDENNITGPEWNSMDVKSRIKLLRYHFPKLSLKFADWKWDDLTPMIKKELTSKSVKESYDSNNDFDGTGLIVVGSTQLDNNAIGDMLEETDFYGIWNTREGYWFFPEAEETLDILEKELEQEFIQRGISARFEGQYY
jgi:hypothetical protein